MALGNDLDLQLRDGRWTREAEEALLATAVRA